MPGPQPATARNRAPGSSMPTQAAARSRSRFAYAACVRRCQTSRPGSTLFLPPPIPQASGHSSPECRGEACPFRMSCPDAAKRQRVRGLGRGGDLWPAAQSVQPGRRKRSTICVLCRTPGSPRNPLKFRHHNGDDRCHGRTLRRRYDNPRKYNGLRPAHETPVASCHLITPPSFGSNIRICRDGRVFRAYWSCAGPGSTQNSLPSGSAMTVWPVWRATTVAPSSSSLATSARTGPGARRSKCIRFLAVLVSGT